MPYSRRKLLRSSAVSLGILALGGCSTNQQTQEPIDTTESPTQKPTTQKSTPTPKSTTEKSTATESESRLNCELTPRPESGWPFPERSAGRTNYAATASGPTQKPTAKWTVTGTDPEIGDLHFTRPVIANNRIYIGRRILVGPERPKPDKQYIEAYDRKTGTQQWRSSVSGTPRTPFVTENHLFVSDETTIYSFDTATGKRQWTYKPDGGVNSMVLTPNSVLVASERFESPDAVHAFSRNGDFQWMVQFPDKLAPQISSKIAWSDDRAYVVTVEGVLVAIDTTKPDIVWTLNLVDGKDTAPSRLIATPCMVFVATNGILYGISRSGELEWSNDVGVRELATDGQAIYGVNGDGYVQSISIDGNGRNWRQFYGYKDRRRTDGFLYEPAIDTRTLYAGSLDGKLVATALDDGQTRWQIQRDWDGKPHVSVVDQTLYVAWGPRLIAYE